MMMMLIITITIIITTTTRTTTAIICVNCLNDEVIQREKRRPNNVYNVQILCSEYSVSVVLSQENVVQNNLFE